MIALKMGKKILRNSTAFALLKYLMFYAGGNTGFLGDILYLIWNKIDLISHSSAQMKVDNGNIFYSISNEIYLIFCCPLQEEVENALGDILDSIKVQERGVFVQASTLGSLEALLEFLRTSKIPVSMSY